MTTEPTREIIIAFDGACRGNPGPGSYGAILLNTLTNSEKIVQGREPSATTNNRMELSAAIAGLNALNPGAIVTMNRCAEPRPHPDRRAAPRSGALRGVLSVLVSLYHLQKAKPHRFWTVLVSKWGKDSPK